MPLALAITVASAAIIGAFRLQLPLPAWGALAFTTIAVAFVASRVIDWRFGMVAAGVFASTPMILADAASLPVALLIVEIAWLAAMERYQRTGARRWLAAAAIILGAGAAIDGDATIILSALAAATALAVLLVDDPRTPGHALVWPALCGLAAAAPFAIYLATPPEWISSRAAAYSLYDARRFNPLQGAREVTSWVGLTARSETYWHYLDPSFLFFSGSVFLITTAVLLPLGIARVLFEPRRLTVLVLLALLCAPLPGSLLLQGPFAERMVPAAPFAALLVAMAIRSLWTSDRLLLRVLGGASAVALAGNAIALALTVVPSRS